MNFSISLERGISLVYYIIKFFLKIFFYAWNEDSIDKFWTLRRDYKYIQRHMNFVQINCNILILNLIYLFCIYNMVFTYVDNIVRIKADIL